MVIAQPEADRTTRVVILIILVTAAARLLLAATIGLGVDESYAVGVSPDLSLGYFDHPPLVFWIAGVIVRGVGIRNRVVLRLPFILLFAGTTWMMFRLGARLFGLRAGMYGALLLNLSPVFSLSTGGWILPDGPLMFFEAATALSLSHALFECPGTSGPSPAPWRDRGRWWVAAGIATGGAFLSKYHAIFVALGVLVFLATESDRRGWLRRPEPYIAAAVAFTLFLPVLVWNHRHGWVSFRFQAGRSAPQPGGIHLGALAQNLAGQAGYILPWIWIPLVGVLVQACRTGPKDPARWFLLCLAGGPILVFTFISLDGRVGLPHWPAPGFLMLFPILGAAIVAREPAQRASIHRWIRFATAALVALVAIAASQVATGWIGRLAPALFARGDPSLEALDWSELPVELHDAGLASVVRAGGFVGAPHWIQAGKIAYALGPAVPVLCLSDDPRQFFYLYDDRRFLGKDAILVDQVERRRRTADVLQKYGRYFKSVEWIGNVPIRRFGHPVIDLALFRGIRFERTVPTPLPR